MRNRVLTASLLLSLLGLGGCVGTAVGVATDVAVEAVKVPFKVGGAVIDGVKGDDDDKEDRD